MIKLEKRMSKFFKDLKSGLEDIVEYKNGKLKLSSEFIEISELPATHKAKNLNHGK